MNILLRGSLVLTLMVLGCATPSTPMLGVVSAGSYTEAARMAVDDARRDHPSLRVDTMYLSQSSNFAAGAVQIANQLLAQRGLVGVVGHVTSGSSLAASQLYNDARVVQLSPTATAVLYSNAGPYSYRMVPPDDAQGRFLANVLERDFAQGARVALLYVNDDYGRGLRTNLLEVLDTMRFPLVLELPHSEDDVRPGVVALAASSVRAAAPDVIVFLGSSTSLGPRLASLRDAVGDTPILASDAVSSWSRFEGDSIPWRGIRVVDFVDMNGTEALRTFAARYRERTGLEATGPDALTYDAVRVILEAVHDGAATGEDVRAYLASLGRERPPYNGLTGALAFSDAGDPERLHVLLTIPPESPRR